LTVTTIFWLLALCPFLVLQDQHSRTSHVAQLTSTFCFLAYALFTTHNLLLVLACLCCLCWMDILVKRDKSLILSCWMDIFSNEINLQSYLLGTPVILLSQWSFVSWLSFLLRSVLDDTLSILSPSRMSVMLITVLMCLNGLCLFDCSIPLIWNGSNIHSFFISEGMHALGS
jgi:hypothetical protein